MAFTPNNIAQDTGGGTDSEKPSIGGPQQGRTSKSHRCKQNCRHTQIVPNSAPVTPKAHPANDIAGNAENIAQKHIENERIERQMRPGHKRECCKIPGHINV